VRVNSELGMSNSTTNPECILPEIAADASGAGTLPLAFPHCLGCLLDTFSGLNHLPYHLVHSFLTTHSPIGDIRLLG
jgi:hypothetical protein